MNCNCLSAKDQTADCTQPPAESLSLQREQECAPSDEYFSISVFASGRNFRVSLDMKEGHGLRGKKLMQFYEIAGKYGLPAVAHSGREAAWCVVDDVGRATLPRVICELARLGARAAGGRQ